jgi:hypothetical protein
MSNIRCKHDILIGSTGIKKDNDNDNGNDDETDNDDDETDFTAKVAETTYESLRGRRQQ